jgi:hypothetical protein
MCNVSMSSKSTNLVSSVANIVLEAHSLIGFIIIRQCSFYWELLYTRRKCGTQIHNLLVPVKQQKGYY